MTSLVSAGAAGLYNRGLDQGMSVSEPEATPISVLLIRDDAAERARTMRLLRARLEGASVAEVGNHIGFFRALERPFYDVVITDARLHWSTGLEVLNAVKSLQPATPVVMLADPDDDATADQALDQGLDGWVALGDDWEDRLIFTLARVLGRAEAPATGPDDASELSTLGIGLFRARLDGVVLTANTAFLDGAGVAECDDVRVVLDAPILDRLRAGEGVHGERIGVVVGEAAPVSRWLVAAAPDGENREGELIGAVVDAPDAEAAAGTVAGPMAVPDLIDQVCAPVALVDETGLLTAVNRRFVDLVAYRHDEIVQRMCLTELAARDDVDRIRRQHRACLDGEETTSLEHGLVDRRGQVHRVRTLLAFLPETHRVLVSMADVTECRRLEEQVLHEAFHDGLTRLPNRFSLLDRIDSVRSEATEGGFALMVVDLDRFGRVNASLGHRTGDEVLRGAARRLETVIGPDDSLGSLGGDGFGVLVRPASHGPMLAATIVDAFSSPLRLPSRPVTCTASVGVVDGDPACGGEELLRRAELAVREAKATGGSRWMPFAMHLIERSQGAFELEESLRRAIPSDLQLHYQAVGDLATGELVGFEALLRWDHAEHGMLGPSEFLPVAVQGGLVPAVTAWVLDEACRQAAEWEGLYVGVNLSGVQVGDALVGQVERSLESTSLEPSRLILEVAETERPQVPIGAIEVLDGLGVRLCVDGFTGSIAVLRPPLHLVKLERLLLPLDAGDAEGWRRYRRVLDTAVESCREVVAVGVERRSQLEGLRAIGCRLAQGRLLGGPVRRPAAEVVRSKKVQI